VATCTADGGEAAVELWYELQEDTTVLHKPRKGDGKIPSYPGHGGLSSGEVTPMAVTAGMVAVTLPKHERSS